MKLLRSFINNDAAKLIAGFSLFALALICGFLKYDTISVVLYIAALLASGCGVYFAAAKGILRGDFLDEKFLMAIASIGAIIIGEYTEGVAVMLFFLVGEMFEHRAVSRSRGRIRALMDICPDEATVIRDGLEQTLDSDDVEVGDILLIRAGERVPVDCEIISGFADADTSAITGEPIPRSVKSGDMLESGTIVIGGILHAKAIRAADESSAQRILGMVENATENKAKEERFITAFSKVYTPFVVITALLIGTVPSIFGWTEWHESVYRALIFLVISCPCALVISVPMAFFGGIGAAASKGILFKGGNSFAPIAKSSQIAFDKTGTLTSGEFQIDKVYPVAFGRDELLSVAASVEYGSNHPIAKAFRNIERSFKAEKIEELAGRGVIGYTDGVRVAVGNRSLMESEGALVPEHFYAISDSVVFVSKNGLFVGAITISDSERLEARKAMEMLRNVGITRTFILSGDKKARVESIGKALGIDEIKAELLPDEKYAELEKIKKNGKTMYVGDGINDTPALALADVGVAMGGVGSDSAIESSDLVIVSDNLVRISDAIRISRKTLRIAKQNIVFAIGIKALIMVLGALGIANMWLAVFADVGVAVIAILNSMRTLLYKAD